MIIGDIETSPLPMEQIKAVVNPYEPPKPPGEFDSATVKYGNTKDHLKRRMKLAEASEKHAETIVNYGQTCIDGEIEYWAKAREKAALSPLTGKVVAIGYLSADTNEYRLDIQNEPSMLATFWREYMLCRAGAQQFVGHNIHEFDVPFLVRRSWVLDIPVPDTVFDGRYIDDKTFVDTMKRWSCGIRGPGFIKLDTLAKLFGVGGKPEGVDGGMFADLLKTDREAAEEYLRNDLAMTRGVAERMGLT